MMVGTKDRTHFIGIGGIGMSAVARILNGLGAKVTGSDGKMSDIIASMRAEGIECFLGHDEKNLGGSRTVVYSSAIAPKNEELAAARRMGIKTLHRAEMLSMLAEGKTVVAVTGSHGKTTASALIALIFENAGRDPRAAVGGEMLNFGSNALCGKGDYFILEADESDGSFLKFRPRKAVLLNIDREHLDYFKDMDSAIRLYRRFAENTAPRGRVYYNADDRILRGLMKGRGRGHVGFGTSEAAGVRAVRIRQRGMEMRFSCVIDGRLMPGEAVIPMPGRHNVTNALAAIAVSYDSGIGFDKIKRALALYRGTKRRFQVRAASGGVTVIEDYAHHPSEIKAVLRACAPFGKNIIVVFQPHRYTRTRDLFKEFIGCFKPAGRVILTDIYPAGERPVRGVTSKALLREMKKSGIRNAEYMKKNAVAGELKKTTGEGDMVLVLGAGDINEVASEL